MEGIGSPQSPAAAAAAMSAVLYNDDLLGEILLRVAFPTSLVRAAVVCKRWLRLASAPAFLRRFRGLHPPRLLGFYISSTHNKTPRFVAIPQSPELAAVVRRGSFNLHTVRKGCDGVQVDCCNGLLLLTYYVRNQPPVRNLRCPLYPARCTILPPVPDTSIHGLRYDVLQSEILPNGVSYFYFATVSKKQQTVIDVYVLQEGTWAICSSTVSEIPDIGRLMSTPIGGGGDKIYSVVCVSQTKKLFMLDLVSSSLSLVNLPEEVNLLSMLLSLADDSGVHLTHVRDFQIRIWLHKMDNNGVANWFLVNTICLREICTNNMIPSCVFEHEEDAIMLYAVGENSEFVLLEKDDVVYMFDLKCKVAKKVYEARRGEYLYDVISFMMVWPPKFPVIMEGCEPNPAR